MSVAPKTTLRDAAMKAREGSKKLVDWIDEARVLAGTADFTNQLGSDLAVLVADARKRGTNNECRIASGAMLLTEDR